MHSELQARPSQIARLCLKREEKGKERKGGEGKEREWKARQGKAQHMRYISCQYK
jgi:hypothetical protein